MARDKAYGASNRRSKTIEQQRKRATVRRIYKVMVNGCDLNLVDQLFAQDVTEHEMFGVPQNGRTDLHDLCDGSFAAFPAFRTTIHDLIAEDDKVVARAVPSGRHSGSFIHLERTGRTFELTGIDIMRCRDLPVIEH